MLPSVTIITPTTPRRGAYNKLCAKYGKYQDYKGAITHLWDYEAGTIGEKLNRMCEQAHPGIILRFDSDDYYSPEYVRFSVEAIVETGADVTGLSSAYFYQPNSRCLKYKYKGGQRYVLGATLCFTKDVWVKGKFKHISNGEDLYFLEGKNIRPHNHIDHFCAIIHSGNTTSDQKYYGESYERADIKIPQRIMGDEFINYVKP